MRYQVLNLPCAWTAAELQSHPDWIYNLSKSELREIDDGLRCCATQKTYMDISRDQFPIPQLAEKIHTTFLDRLENGIGAFLVRGLPIEKYTILELEKILYGIGLYFGIAVSQSTKGETLHHVYDQGYARDDEKARGTNTSVGIVMHNDTCDVPALLCVRKAQEGGISKLVSSVAIHNEMVEHYPDLLAELYRPYYSLRARVHTTSKEAFYVRPIFANINNHFTCNILRRYIDLAQTHQDIPKMTPVQINALDVFDELASSEKLCHYFQLEPGDILFSNSYTTLHAREAFLDADDPDKKRLLLRLWLSVKNSRPLPESYKGLYRDIRPGAIRGGILPEES